MIRNVAEEYRRREGDARAAFDRSRLRMQQAQGIFLVCVLATVLLVIDSMKHGLAWEWFATGAVGSLAALVATLYQRGRSEVAWRRVSLYEKALARVSGEQPNSGFTGEAFAREGHLFQDDLNVLGKDSLFDRIATTRTTVGQRGLAKLLLDAATTAMGRERQEAVRELSQDTDLRERVALIGRSKFEDVPAESLEEWLGRQRSGTAVWLRWVLLAITLSGITMGLGGLALHFDGHLLMRNLAVLIGLQALLCLRLRTAVNRELESAQRLFGQTAILREGLRLLRSQQFSSALLCSLQQQAMGEDKALARLERWLTIVEQRPKEWFYTLSLIFCLGTHAAIALEQWRAEFGEPMRRWIEAWADFEALVAVGTYAAEHEENAYPELVDGAHPIFEARGMKHPLLASSAAVANDVMLGTEAQFLLISGSNMAGKSTLLRAIGASMVLALAGAPVAAQSLRLGLDSVGASLSLNDSLSEGKSKFLAEVERLRAIVDLARSQPGRTLFLIDEILAGTNSLDRRAAAESVLRALVDAHAVGAISTHDLTLTAIADLPGLHGVNVHMASPDEDDPLGFDYKLKPGINQTTNALAIVRMMGLA
jgi:hypothetical protein